MTPGIFRACRDLSLEPSLRIIYRPRDYGLVYMLDHVVQDIEDRGQWELDYLNTELQSRGTLISATQDDWAWSPRRSTTFPEIVWITRLRRSPCGFELCQVLGTRLLWAIYTAMFALL